MKIIYGGGGGDGQTGSNIGTSCTVALLVLGEQLTRFSGGPGLVRHYFFPVWPVIYFSNPVTLVIKISVFRDGVHKSNSSVSVVGVEIPVTYDSLIICFQSVRGKFCPNAILKIFCIRHLILSFQ